MDNSNNSSNNTTNKTIYLIRHGQSTFNEVYNGFEDPYLFDARLTKVGENQADQLSETIEKHLLDKVELIITSPLTRALETCKRSCSKLIELKVPCIVMSEHRELLTTSDDNGRVKSIIEKEYPEFNFSLINDERWWIPEHYQDLKLDLSIDTNDYFKKYPFRESESLFLNRVNQFRQYLLSREESNIIVVGHGDFFYYLLNNESMEDIINCKIIQWSINNNQSSYLNLN